MRFRDFPLSAWWGPIGYNNGPDADAAKQLATYAAANYTVIQLSDRQAKDVNKTADDAWSFIQESIEKCDRLGMQVLIDTYSPLTRELQTQCYSALMLDLQTTILVVC